VGCHVGLVLCLDAEHPDYFQRLMRGCRNLSNSGYETDGLHELLTDGEQDLLFISESSQIAAVREFMQSLPDTLRA